MMFEVDVSPWSALTINAGDPAFAPMCEQYEWFHIMPVAAVLSARNRANRSLREGGIA